MLTDYRIVRAGPGDLRLAQQAILLIHGRGVCEHAALDDFLSDPTCYLLLSLKGAEVVGSLYGYALKRPHIGAGTFLIYEIDVREDLRRQGIGTAMLNRFIEEARTGGGGTVWLLTNDSNAAALALYRACGLQRPHQDDVMLRLVLERNDGTAAEQATTP